MITAVIQHKQNTLVTQFPLSNYNLSDQLGSIGIVMRAGDIPVSGKDGIEINLVADEEIGSAILKRLTDEDTLSGLNMACQMVEKCTLYGCDEFLDMLDPKPNGRYAFYRPYETLPPSTESGVKGILEEVRRYSVTMENHRKICEAEEQGFDEPDDEGWDR